MKEIVTQKSCRSQKTNLKAIVLSFLDFLFCFVLFLIFFIKNKAKNWIPFFCANLHFKNKGFGSWQCYSDNDFMDFVDCSVMSWIY